MAENTVKLDLDPQKILQAINDMKEAFQGLSEDIESTMGKQAPQSIAKSEKAAEDGSNKILNSFRNMGKRLKEDLKTAFDFGSIVGGLKLAKEMAEGIKQVFDLEKAFDKLNTRLGLTGQRFLDFKKNVGTAVSATGQKMEDIFPGIETAAAKGNVRSPEELAQIGKNLAEVRAATGESTDQLTDSVVEILRSQGKKVTAQTFASTLDALQATRVQGAFKTAGEAGAAIEQISPYSKQMGLDTRQMAALVATASKSGQAGQDILRQIMEQAAQPGGQEKLNAILGARIFKGGRFDASQLGNINTGRFGKYSQQAIESATGITGAAGSDLTRFVDSFKNNMADFNKVVKGSNETADQFKTATDNLASGIDKFKQRTINATRTIGEDLSTAANDILKGKFKEAGKDALGAVKAGFENKGTLAGALGVSLGASILMGGGMNSLLKKLPGGGLLTGAVGGAAAEAAGIQKVYVVNMSEAGGAGLGGSVAGAMGSLGKFGGALGTAGLYGGAALAGYEGAKLIDQIPAVHELGQKMADVIVGALYHPEPVQPTHPHGGNAGSNDHTSMKEAVAQGVVEGTNRTNKNKQTTYTNPSAVQGKGGTY